MKDIIFSSIAVDLKNAAENSDHPFRYFTLATSDFNNIPRLRTVVLRNVDDDLNMMVYTDERSKKISNIQANNRVSLLFLDQQRLLQISIRAKAEIITDHQVIHKIWEQIPEKSKKDYTTELSPGKEIKNPEDVDYLEGKHFFSAIKITPIRIEYLRLKRPIHTRVIFKKELGEWKGTYLVP
ncbi:pyridoxamine 5'-phosphate oxidase family protein [Aquimarina sp. MMG016]|uniref:pyridoxamine 5'-phosphate oxidase family protein n=1 Tax=Aquimarina sp. MMG016 TaxID=2822690 RepID=UPI001B3A2195|nr:pyridoxamine 5'-phosphate oxidase family protein [Aquimarina sp. MMG016]MBQ4819041.1 pyridoxamine 5'-phosphate oxidase family protein [Aquimarina sp. MMG016]